MSEEKEAENDGREMVERYHKNAKENPIMTAEGIALDRCYEHYHTAKTQMSCRSGVIDESNSLRNIEKTQKELENIKKAKEQMR